MVFAFSVHAGGVGVGGLVESFSNKYVAIYIYIYTYFEGCKMKNILTLKPQ